MTTNHKPLLTRKQLDDYFRSDRISSYAYNTIERMAELLERVLKYPYTVTGDTLLRQDITETLSTFNATGGEGEVVDHTDLRQQLATITQERDALREENARLRQLVTTLVAGDQMAIAS